MKKLLPGIVIVLCLVIWQNLPATTVTSRPAQSQDDISWVQSPADCSLAYTEMTLGNDGDSNLIFIRFPGITIPQGTTIDSAIITFTANATESGTTCNVQFKGEDTANAPAFDGCTVGTVPLNVRHLTSQHVEWSSVPSFTSGSTYNSPNIGSIVGAVIGKAGWASGNALVIQVNAYTSTVSTGVRHAYSYDGSSTVCPLLSIYYGGGGGGSSTVVRVVAGGPLGVGKLGGPTGVAVQ